MSLSSELRNWKYY